MISGPRDPQQIAQEILNDDTDGMEDLLKDTEVEDEDIDEEDFYQDDPYQDDSYERDDGGYF